MKAGVVSWQVTNSATKQFYESLVADGYPKGTATTATIHR